MSAITLEAIKAEHDRLGALIQQLAAPAAEHFFMYGGEKVRLNAGEIYVGTIVLPEPTKSRHLVLLPGEQEKVTWAAAKDWASSRGGELPDRVESALLFARHKSEFHEEWYWTREQSASGSDCAWLQDFASGDQRDDRTRLKFRARAVRRLTLE